MQTIRQHRILVLAVVGTLAVGALALLTLADPWGASATGRRSGSPSVAAAVDERGSADTTPVGDETAGDGELADPSPWTLNGMSPATLGQADWDCLFVVHAVHCAPPGGLVSIATKTAETLTVLVFDTTDPGAEDARYLGTEVNIRADLFHGQPCPTDPPSEQYTYLGPGGLNLGFDYYACHRFDSPL